MNTLLTSLLEVKSQPLSVGAPIPVRMTITNTSNQSLEIVNFDVGVPPTGLNWTFSEAAYRAAVLMSFGLLKLELQSETGQSIQSKGLNPWVTPVLGKQTLQPNDSVVLEFDLNELFSIDSPGRYRLHARIGTDALYAEADTDIEIVAP